MKALYELLPSTISGLIFDLPIAELRLRIGKPLYFYNGKVWRIVNQSDLSGPYIVSQADIDYILGIASGYSIYSINDCIIKGFVHYKGGIRIGIGGEGVLAENQLNTVKFISFLTIRVPREVIGCADRVIDKILFKNNFKNTLLISPPAGGKTTMLREIARLTSNSGKNVLIIDERFEITATYKGVPTMNVGWCTDVISGIPKTIAYENIIRSMNPDVIFTDELYQKSEIDAIIDACRTGVSVGATLHADNENVLNYGIFKPLNDIFKVIIVLSKKKSAGTIEKVIVND